MRHKGWILSDSGFRRMVKLGRVAVRGNQGWRGKEKGSIQETRRPIGKFLQFQLGHLERDVLAPGSGGSQPYLL